MQKFSKLYKRGLKLKTSKKKRLKKKGEMLINKIFQDAFGDIL